jgi:hypothetical protein
MASVNEAWQVLRDPGRRALYDASLRPAPAHQPPPARPAPGDDLGDAPADDGHELARVARWGTPALWLLVLGVLAAIFIFTAYAASRHGDGLDPPAPAIDGVLELSDCVAAVNERGRVVAVEVACSEPHVGTAESLMTFDQACPAATLEYPVQGRVQKVCVRT